MHISIAFIGKHDPSIDFCGDSCRKGNWELDDRLWQKLNRALPLTTFNLEISTTIHSNSVVDGLSGRI